MTTSPGTTPVHPAARRIVERVDRRYCASLCTAPVLDAAASMLVAWCAAAGEQGADMTGPQGAEWADRLAIIAVEMATRRVRQLRPQTPEQATVLLDAVVDRIGERGTTTTRDGLYVPLPRTGATPAWGAFEPCRLAITIGVERGRELVIDQPTASPVMELVGRCDGPGLTTSRLSSTLAPTATSSAADRQRRPPHDMTENRPLTPVQEAAVRLLVAQATTHVGRTRDNRLLRSALRWATRGRLGRRPGWLITSRLGRPWDDTACIERADWRTRAAYVDHTDEPVFAVDYRVCRRCQLG